VAPNALASRAGVNGGEPAPEEEAGGGSAGVNGDAWGLGIGGGDTRGAGGAVAATAGEGATTAGGDVETAGEGATTADADADAAGGGATTAGADAETVGGDAEGAGAARAGTDGRVPADAPAGSIGPPATIANAAISPIASVAWRQSAATMVRSDVRPLGSMRRIRPTAPFALVCTSPLRSRAGAPDGGVRREPTRLLTRLSKSAKLGHPGGATNSRRTAGGALSASRRCDDPTTASTSPPVTKRQRMPMDAYPTSAAGSIVASLAIVRVAAPCADWIAQSLRSCAKDAAMAWHLDAYASGRGRLQPLRDAAGASWRGGRSARGMPLFLRHHG
jgi:hypothetical protein